MPPPGLAPQKHGTGAIYWMAAEAKDQTDRQTADCCITLTAIDTASIINGQICTGRVFL